MKYDLSWGNSRCVREALIRTVNGFGYQFRNIELMELDYPPHDGNAELIKITKKVIKRQTNQDYRHVYLTNGATGGVTIALRAYKDRDYVECLTREAPYFSLYPDMIRASGLLHIEGSDFCQHPDETVVLLDFPSNPWCFTDNIAKSPDIPVIIDGAYLSRVYTVWSDLSPLPVHNVMVGSYSKLLGLNGIRVGWIATNDDLLAERIKRLVTGEYCGLSVADSSLLLVLLNKLNTTGSWGEFEKNARQVLDNNRTSWSKLEKYFDRPVNAAGMFYCAKMDAACKRLFKKAGVSWMNGSKMGASDSLGRFNLGQSNDIVTKAAAAVLKADQIK